MLNPTSNLTNSAKGLWIPWPATGTYTEYSPCHLHCAGPGTAQALHILGLRVPESSKVYSQTPSTFLRPLQGDIRRGLVSSLGKRDLVKFRVSRLRGSRIRAESASPNNLGSSVPQSFSRSISNISKISLEKIVR